MNDFELTVPDLYSVCNVLTCFKIQSQQKQGLHKCASAFMFFFDRSVPFLKTLMLSTNTITYCHRTHSWRLTKKRKRRRYVWTRLYTWNYLCSEYQYSYIDCYRPQRSCGQGYVFTRVCDSVHRGGLRAAPPRTRQTPPQGLAERTPRDQADPPPDQADPPGPGRLHPPQTWQGEPPPPWTRQISPPPQDLAGRTPTAPPPQDLAGRTPPDQADTPVDQADTPPDLAGRTPPPPGRRLQHTVNKRPVRILLECILVQYAFMRYQG